LTHTVYPQTTMIDDDDNAATNTCFTIALHYKSLVMWLLC